MDAKTLQLNSVGDEYDKTYHQILHFVQSIICSPAWETSICLEQKKANEKSRSILNKAYKLYKISNPGLLPIIPDIICDVKVQLKRTREVKIVPMGTRRKIATFCADAIHKHTILLDKMCTGVITECKLRNITVGLLYMMKVGITIHGVVVLPKCVELQRILPQENHLQNMFGIKGKVWTTSPHPSPPNDVGIRLTSHQITGYCGVGEHSQARPQVCKTQ